MIINNITIEVPRLTLPSTVKEGDVLIIEFNKYAIDKKETEKSRREIQNLLDKLFE
ncbi:pyruvate kinase [Bacillus thuringiensis serovar yunnanensis]|nr:pyruvate kinase [Bacillus thuringiensis serovar yunnanensis]